MHLFLHLIPSTACFLLVLALSPTLFIQEALAQKEAPARKDLQALRTKYTGSGTVDANVTLEIKMPESSSEIQKGRIVQQGDRFYIKLAGQEITSDGKTTWLYLPDNKEVQVYEASEANATAGSFTRPQDILELYDSNAFDYAITGSIKKEGRDLKQIEFKPTDRNSEYAKLRLTYDPAKQEIYSVEVFNKDGSRFTLTLTSVKMNATVPASTFTFDPKSKPGVRVEDMRL